MTVGETVQGTLEYENDIDLFVFQAEEGVLYQIDVALGTLSDSLVGLYDADERELAYNDDHGDSLASRVFWQASRSGAYYIAVEGYDTGSYTLTVTTPTTTPPEENTGAIEDGTSLTVASDWPSGEAFLRSEVRRSGICWRRPPPRRQRPIFHAPGIRIAFACQRKLDHCKTEHSAGACPPTVLVSGQAP